MSSKKNTFIPFALYDFANSAYFTIIITFIFSAYFIKHIAPDVVTGTSVWGKTLACSGFLIAVFSPVFGAIADYSGLAKRFLFVSTYIGCIATSLLFFVTPKSNVMVPIILIIVSSDYI